MQTPRHLRAQAAAYRAPARAAVLPGSVVYQGISSANVLPAGQACPPRRMLVAKYQDIDSVPGLIGFNSLFGFTALKVKLASFVALGQTSVPIRPFLSSQTFDPETTRLMGVAFESARAAVKRPGDLTDEMIASRIIELAKAGERNVEVLCEAALNVRAGAISAPNSPPLLAPQPALPDSSS